MNKRETLRPREAAIASLKLSLRRFVVDLLVSNFEATEDVGLNSTDLGALCHLLLHGPASAGRLAELTGVTTGAVTGVVDRLEQRRFVRREADPADRRKVIIAPDAAQVDRRLFPYFPTLKRAASTTFYDGYTVTELELITGFLSRLTAVGDGGPSPRGQTARR
jgi:DNA-binding MarR family transcriptional regulator